MKSEITWVSRKDVEDAAIIAQVVGAFYEEQRWRYGEWLVCRDNCPGHACGQCEPSCVGAAIGASRRAVDLFLFVACGIDHEWHDAFEPEDHPAVRAWRRRLGLAPGERLVNHGNLEASALLMAGVLPPRFRLVRR